MRLLVHILLVLMVVGILGGVSFRYLHQTQREQQIRLAQAEVSRFQQQVHLRAALASDERMDRSMPRTIDPKWFGPELPQNPLLGPEHPWVEIAGPDQKNRVHPPDLTATSNKVASFWYNPDTGVVRARVPVGVSDATTLALYNQINDSTLTSLFSK